ncbi:LysR family transcriptional regulator [Dysosmobacter sp.]|uniref:LysR family transcriptional regulator n=1 Tax=Dysosmobacter sp. TaxID=2591382 RepID=UPI002A8C6D57|nr:LysR family transcriptional regulator [Dysosmobacter sp.]MDY3984494.1 LysR family transcriptional regulator [Dysosmobacter sp.]
MNYQDMEIFLSLVTTRNISRTANLLYLAQSTVSHRLKALEAELGCCLVERNKGKASITFTDRGKAFIPIAEKWRSVYLETCNFKSTDEQIYITLGSVDSYSAYIFPSFYKNIFANHPNLHLTVRTYQIAGLFRNVANHTIDIGLSSHSMSDAGVLNTALFSEPIYFLCSAQEDPYPEYVDVQALDPGLELYFNWSADYQSWHQYWFGLLVNPRITLDKASLIRQYLLDSPYWAAASASVARNLVLSGDIHCHRFLQPPPERTCYRVINRENRLLHHDAYRFFNLELDAFVRDRVAALFEADHEWVYSP